MSTIQRSDKLDFFVYVLSGYVNTRTSNSYNSRNHGYSHAFSVLDAAKQRQGWVRNLTAAYNALPDSDKDLAKIQLAFFEYLTENRLTMSPEQKQCAEEGLNIAAGIPTPERPPFSPGFPDDYRDDLQPSIQPYDFN